MLITENGHSLQTVVEFALLRFGLIALVVLVGVGVLIAGIALLGRRGRAADGARTAEPIVREVIRRIDERRRG